MKKLLITTALITVSLIFPATASATHEGDSHSPVASWPAEPTWSPPNWGSYPATPTWSPPNWGSWPAEPTWPGITNNPCCSR